MFYNLRRKRLAFLLYNGTLVGLAAYFVYAAYIDGRTSSFISLDNTSGVCVTDAKSSTCCEVPQTISGTFLADTSGRWNTEPGFSYTENSYAVSTLGLEYTNAEWTGVMRNISAQLQEVGTKGASRDLAW